MNWPARTAEAGCARSALCALSLLMGSLLVLESCAPTVDDQAIPPVEAWGDWSQPYGDAIDEAARKALEPLDSSDAGRDQVMSLEEFFALDIETRRLREANARRLRERAIILERTTGVDSLELYLQALRAAPVDIPSYEEACRILLDRGAWQRTHALAVQGIRLDRQNGLLWAMLGATYAQADDRTRARAAFEVAMRLRDPNVQRSNIAERLAAFYIQEGEYERADSLVAATADAIPAWMGHYARAKAAEVRGGVDEARQQLRAAGNDSTAPGIVHADLGHLERNAGNLEAAEAAYREALRLDPHLQAAHNGLGAVQWARGEYDAALTRFQDITTANPTNYSAHYNYAGALLDAAAASDDDADADRMYALAARHFGACIDADYEVPRALAGRAQAHLARGELDAAIADARQLALWPGYEESARLLMARASLSAGNPREVVAQLEASFESGSLSDVGLAMLGKALLELDRYERAAAVLLRAIEGGASNLSVAMNYAIALSESGKFDEAERVLRALVEEHPNEAALLQNLAAVLQRQGRIYEADQLLIRVNRLEGR